VSDRRGQLWVRHAGAFQRPTEIVYYVIGSTMYSYKIVNMDDSTVKTIKKHVLDSASRSMKSFISVTLPWDVWWERIA